MSVRGLVSELEHSKEASTAVKEKGDSVACQILLLTILMEVN